MTYTLQITHPNEMLRDRWVTVDSFDDADELPAHLQSPTFEWYHGMLVRCLCDDENPIYTGIYGTSECVDVGFESNRYNEIMLYYAVKKHPGLSYLQYWKLEYEPEDMIGSLVFFMPRDYVVRVVGLCAKEMLSMLPKDETRPRVLFDEIMKHRDGDLMTRLSIAGDVNRDFIRESDARENDFHARIGRSMSSFYACVTANDISFTGTIRAAVISIGSTMIDEINEKYFADEIRQFVPFYDLAIKIAK